MRTTLRDVAAAAGVSVMTVSKVLHGTGTNVRVSEERSALIKQKASELHYQPNDLARSLRNRRTMTVGVVFRQFTRLNDRNPYFPQLLNGVMAALFENGYSLALCPKLAAPSNEGNVADGRFDGILWCRPDFTDSAVKGLARSPVPVVMMHAPAELAAGIPTYCADNDGAMRSVAEHLAALGHRTVAFVIDETNKDAAEAKWRAEAFVAHSGRLGMKADILVWGDDPICGVREYQGPNRPHTALAVFSETYAGAILDHCLDLGIRVPEDLSVVGFDSSPFCDTTTPRLTAVSQPVERMAYEATVHLVRLINAEAEGVTLASTNSTIYSCGLDVRESTARQALNAETHS